MTTHATDLMELALLRWIDHGMEFDPEPGRWPLETRGLRYVAAASCREYILAELWNCPDTLPDSYCDRLQIRRGSTYSEAARKIWRQHLGEVERPAA